VRTAWHSPRRWARSFLSGTVARKEAVSEICRDEIVRSPAAADVHPGSGGTYQVAVGIERVQLTPFIERYIRLNSPQGILAYEKRCLDSAIMSPKPHRASRAVI
jgi:hypothetical protein